MSTRPDSEDYNSRLEALLRRPSSQSLDTMKRLTKLYPIPKNTIHIAGTNGKGSVSLKVAEGLRLSGYKVGLYTSPHIDSFRERIKINGNEIEEEDFLRLLPDDERASFFEIITCLAFRWFVEEKVDYAVIETGLGGRWDATNIIHPILSIITSIGWDHTELLGNTLEKIAKEKGGIIKPGVAVISGPKADYYPKAIKVLGNFKSFEEENRAVAKRALEVLEVKEEVIQEALVKTPPCRMEWIGGKVLFDVAHNPSAFQRLVDSIDPKPFTAVVAFCKDKDIEGCLKVLRPLVKTLYLTQSKEDRAIESKELAKIALSLGYDASSLKTFPTPTEAITEALKHEEPVLVTGTFYIMQEAKSACPKLLFR